MIVYQDDKVIVDASVDVPVVITIISNNKEYHYMMDGSTNDKCPYDEDIKAWIKKARLELNEIIWAKKENRQPHPITITTPLKLRVKLNLHL